MAQVPPPIPIARFCRLDAEADRQWGLVGQPPSHPAISSSSSTGLRVLTRVCYSIVNQADLSFKDAQWPLLT